MLTIHREDKEENVENYLQMIIIPVLDFDNDVHSALVE